MAGRLCPQIAKIQMPLDVSGAAYRQRHGPVRLQYRSSASLEQSLTKRRTQACARDNITTKVLNRCRIVIVLSHNSLWR